MPIWIDPPDTPVPAALQEVVGGHPLVAQVLARRGFSLPEAALAFLDPLRYIPAPPEDLPGMDAACRRIQHALETGQRIWVWGDFDVDGQTSTALLVSVLRELGTEPGYHIPVRARESHGVNIPNLARILDEGADLLITCDTGITAYEALAYAQERGLDVIVTDHHTLGETLPPALAVINPHLLPDGHPLGPLPGVGVAFKLAEALLNQAGRADEAANLLDLAALGIVADVAQQTGDARYLLQRGLEVLRRAKRPGLWAIMELADVNPAWLSEEHIGFAIAPRLNALGRLDDANPAVELLTTPDPNRARILALNLENLNARRQLLTSQVLDSAVKQLERDPDLLDAPALVLAHSDWPAGVIGIAASALVERYNRPVILLASPAGQMARGSARSIEGVDITACITAQREQLHSFGGHAMAAGLALDPANLPAFRRGLGRAVEAAIQASGGPRERELVIDGELRLANEELNLELVADFERLAPFGPGNPPLTFILRDLAASTSAKIGRQREHLQMTVEDRAGNTQKVLWWGGADLPQPQAGARFDLACKLRASNFRGQRELQVEWVDFRVIPEDVIQLATSEVQVTDHRTNSHPRALLESLRGQEGLLIWAEGEAKGILAGQDRLELVSAHQDPERPPRLAIWTAPPGRGELQAVLEALKPREVILFAREPETADPQGFLSRLAGLVKFTLKAGGDAPIPVDLARMAAATAQREAAVRIGLKWLEARGHLRLEHAPEGGLLLAPGSGQESGDAAALQAGIKTLLDETAAYRRFFRSVSVEQLGF
jgi:single-stranded-DNA-specific exonuclease